MAEQTNSADGGFPSDLLVDLRPQQGRGLRERLEHGLRSAIQGGRLPGGTALPPSRVLAAELRVSRSVVVAAYANLTSDGYLEARQGSGTRVRLDAPPGPLAAYRGPPAGRPAIQLVGGLPDPALFPRRQWLRHYGAALTQAPDRRLTYPPPAGATALRVALSGYLGRVRGVDTDHRRMLVCGGVTQGLALVCRALHRGGARRVAVEDPCFGLHREAIAMTGLEPVPVPVDSDGLDVHALADHAPDAVLVAPAHSYPMGGTLGGLRRRELVAWARSRDALIIEDDYDAEFRYDRAPIGALQGLAPDRVVHLGCASKTVSPALRLGWVAAPAWLIEALVREKRFDDMGSSLLEQLAFARFVDGGDFARYLRRVRPVYRRRRDAALAALADLLPAVRPQGASGGLHLLLSLPADVSERALAHAARERGVLVEDAAWHWADPLAAPPSLILGYGSATEDAIRRGIAILAAALGALGSGAERRPADVRRH